MSGNCSSRAGIISSVISPILSSRTFLSSVSRAYCNFSKAIFLIASYRSWSTSCDSYVNFSLPISAWIPLIKSQSSIMCLWANLIPSSITLSSTSLAPASIITTFCFVPATVTSISLFSLCSTVGLITYSPSTRPSQTPPIGPFQGTSEIEIAIEVPIIAATSGGLSCSTESTVATTDTSFLKSDGKSGLIGLSITRLVRIAFSDGLPSRLMYPPGILPTE